MRVIHLFGNPDWYIKWLDAIDELDIWAWEPPPPFLWQPPLPPPPPPPVEHGRGWIWWWPYRFSTCRVDRRSNNTWEHGLLSLDFLSNTVLKRSWKDGVWGLDKNWLLVTSLGIWFVYKCSSPSFITTHHLRGITLLCQPWSESKLFCCFAIVLSACCRYFDPLYSDLMSRINNIFIPDTYSFLHSLRFWRLIVGLVDETKTNSYTKGNIFMFSYTVKLPE